MKIAINQRFKGFEPNSNLNDSHFSKFHFLAFASKAQSATKVVNTKLLTRPANPIKQPAVGRQLIGHLKEKGRLGCDNNRNYHN